jgi:dihydroorotate dehydrogenase electron transfer subunit
MLRAFDGTDPLLGRPLAVFDLPDGEPGSVEVLYDVVGRGTRIFSGLGPGDRVRVLGPLGNGWRPGAGAGRSVVVAGGCGVGGVFLLARRLGAERPGTVTLVLGAASSDGLLSEESCARLTGVEVVRATDDGSEGLRGTAVEAAAGVLDGGGPASLYASGPGAMLKAAAAMAAGRMLPLQVSLEERMACGVGACRGCVVRALEPHPETGLRTRTVCADGPVFDAGEIDWEALG